VQPARPQVERRLGARAHPQPPMAHDQAPGSLRLDRRRHAHAPAVDRVPAHDGGHRSGGRCHGATARPRRLRRPSARLSPRVTRPPSRVAPMLATLVDAPFHRPGWIWEEKYDGIRLIAVKDARRVRLLSRNDKDRSADFPEIVAALAALPAPTLVLDGEVVVFDVDGISRFQLLHRRAAGASPPTYVVCDCLHARGRELVDEPLTARRAALEAEVREGPRLQIARRLTDDGFAAFAEARRRGLEGVIGKAPRAAYV